jgi:hypothetical protein
MVTQNQSVYLIPGRNIEQRFFIPSQPDFCPERHHPTMRDPPFGMGIAVELSWRLITPGMERIADDDCGVL